MDFTLTEEQKMVHQMVKNFVEDEIKERASEIDRTDQFPADLVKKAGDLGLLAINFSEEYGGAGMDTITAALASMEIGSASAAVANIFSSFRHHLFCIDTYGTDEQKRKYMPAISSGNLIGSFALSESDAGSDANGIKTQARLDGDEYVINGNKTWITLGPVADFTIVFAVTGKNEKRNEISAFFVDKDTPGFGVGKVEEKLGQKGNPVSELIFTDCRIPKANMLGKKGEGIKIALHSLDSGRIEVAALGVGLMKASLEDSINYAENRYQFKQKISQFQLIQAFIAEMAADYEASRLLTYQAAKLKDEGKRFTKEASIAKWFSTEAA